MKKNCGLSNAFFVALVCVAAMAVFGHIDAILLPIAAIPFIGSRLAGI